MSEGATETSTDTGGGDVAPETAAEPSAPSAAPDTSEGGGEPTGGGDVAGDAIAAAKAEEERQARKWALKYDGKDHEVTSEEELVKLAQKGLGADRRFEEAATLRKQIEAAARRMADDPLEIMTAIHGDEGKAAQIAARRMLAHPKGREIIEAMLLEQYQYESLPEAERKRLDEDRALRARAARADELEQRERERAEAEQRTAAETKRTAEVERLQRTFADEARASLTAAGLDPNDPDIAERWIMQRMAAMDQGVELTAEEAAKRVSERVGGSRKGYLESLGKLDGDALLESIPAAVLAKIRAADAARLVGKQRAAARQTQTGGKPTPKPAPKRVEVSSDQWLKAVRTIGVAEANRRLEAGEPLFG